MSLLSEPRMEGGAQIATSMTVWNIAVLPGDGIGPEVMHEAVKVLRRIEHCMPALGFRLTELPVGAGEFLRSGNPLPPEALDACARADAILLAAMGLPDVRWPDGRELTPQIDLRETLDLYAGLRPIRIYHTHDTPLKAAAAADIDMVIVRENTEGLFSARSAAPRPVADEANDVMRVTRKGSERLFRAAFDLARRRRRRLTLVDKANVLPSMVFFRAVFEEIAREYPDVQTDKIYVDAAALYLLLRPQSFDVIVTENMFGDILSDLAAGLVGGMGMAPSADLGDTRAVFQPAHGSAPDIASKGIANPVAMILSTAMMLEWFAVPQAAEAARRIRHAVEHVLSDPSHRTPDLGGKLSTAAIGDLIAAHIQ